MKCFKIYTVLILTIICSCNNKDKKTNIKSLSPVEKLNQKILSDPKNPDLYNEKAKLYLEKKLPDSALSNINKAISINSKKSDFYCTLSDIYFSLGKIVKCGDALDKAISIKPDNSEALLKFAELNFYFKKYDKTFEYIKRSLDVDKFNPKAYFMRGMALKEFGDTAKAVADLQTAVEQDPDNFEAYMQLGLLYSVKKNRIAIDYFNNALNIQPGNIEALYGKAMFYQETEDFNNAIMIYNSIIKIKPDYKYAYYNLGYIHLVYLKLYDAAIDYFKKAINYDPKYYEAYYNMGYAFELRGDLRNATLAYKMALEINKNYKKAIDGLNRVQK